MFVPLLLICFGAALIAVVARALTPLEKRYIAACYAAHIVSAFAQVWVHDSFYGISDMQQYLQYGRVIARLLSYDFTRYLPEVIKLALHLDSNLPFIVLGEKTSTGSMSAISGIITYCIGSTSIGSCVLVAIWACCGQLLLYSVARRILPEAERRAALVGLLLVPSVVFWSSALAKEAVTLGFFGILCASTYALFTNKLVRGVAGTFVGTVGVGVLKPYVLFPFFLALGAWIYMSRIRGRRPLWHLPVGAIVGLVGVIAVSIAFPEFSLGQLGETAARQQEAGVLARDYGGSYVDIGGGDVERSLVGQIQFIPLAILNAFFRPTIFEARNVTMAFAGIEMTALTMLFGTTIIRRGFSALRTTFRTPELIFCAVFVLSFGVAVGLTTLNLGTLSRYRMPMLPFYVTLLLLIRLRLRNNAKQHAEQAQ